MGLRELALIGVLTACGGSSRPYSARDLQQDSRASGGDALVHYLGQEGADPGVCDLQTHAMARFAENDFVLLVRGLESGAVPTGRWSACVQRLLPSLHGPQRRAALSTLVERFAASLAGPEEPARLLIMNALAEAIELRPAGSPALDSAPIRAALAHPLGAQARALAERVDEDLQIAQGRYRGTSVSPELLATVADEALLRRLARQLPTALQRRQAEERLVDVAIAESPSGWVRAHAADTRARVLTTGRNALDLAAFPIVQASYAAAAPAGEVAIEQLVEAQSARLWQPLKGHSALLPALPLRDGARFTLQGVEEPVSLCAPAQLLDVSPCVDGAALRVGNPLATVDADGVVRVRSEISAGELQALLAGAELIVPVKIADRSLTELRWPLRLLAPGAVELEHGEALSATVERLGSRVLLRYAAGAGSTSLAIVEERDVAAFSVTTRGAAGAQGHQGSTGTAGMAGSSGASAACPFGAAGDGGPGWAGGRGGDGRPGGAGGVGGDVAVTLVCDKGCDELERIARLLLRSEGGPGGHGGAGGAGGRGGSGGAGGLGVTCSGSTGSSASPMPHVLNAGFRGVDGSDGSRGAHGLSGRSGSPGRITVRRAPSR